MPSDQRRRRRDAPPVRMDLNALLSAVIGPAGISQAGLVALEPELERVRAAIRGRQRGLASLRTELRKLRDVVASLRGIFDTVVVLGVGAVALGAGGLVSALRATSGGLRVVCASSIDPQTLERQLAGLDLRRTLFNVVSVSGDTAATIAQFLIVRDMLLHELGAVDYRGHLLVSTEAGGGAMRQIVNDEGFRELTVPPNLLPPLALWSQAGLFPAAVAGVDVAAILAGAASVEERARSAEPLLLDPPLALAGALRLMATTHGCENVTVVPGSDRLDGVARWFHQLVRSDGLGSDVCIYLRVDELDDGLVVPRAYQDLATVAYLGGHSLAALRSAEQRAAELCRARAGRPSVTITLPSLEPHAVGQLVHLLALTAVALAALRGTSPATADPDRLVADLLGRPDAAGTWGAAEATLPPHDPQFVL